MAAATPAATSPKMSSQMQVSTTTRMQVNCDIVNLHGVHCFGAFVGHGEDRDENSSASDGSDDPTIHSPVMEGSGQGGSDDRPAPNAWEDIHATTGMWCVLGGLQ